MSLCVFDKGRGRLLILLLASILQSTLAASQELPDAPSAVMRTSFYAAGDSVTSADPQQSSAGASADSSRDKFLTRWVKRGLRDQADIYTAPLHRSGMKWTIGLPLVTAGLIAIDKHASGALPRTPSSASADISDVGLFATAGAVGVLLIDGKTQGDSHAFETGVLGAEAMANSGVVYAVLQLIAERERPLQGTGQGHFFQTSGLDNSFPSGHTIITWTAASTIAHEYPKPWVEWLAYGTATAVSVTRFTSLQHFPSDVVVGSTLGYFIGRHIFHAHCKAGLSAACSAKLFRETQSLFLERAR
jgi:membrane-associated phospholipid phosphatase